MEGTPLNMWVEGGRARSRAASSSLARIRSWISLRLPSSPVAADGYELATVRFAVQVGYGEVDWVVRALLHVAAKLLQLLKVHLGAMLGVPVTGVVGGAQAGISSAGKTGASAYRAFGFRANLAHARRRHGDATCLPGRPGPRAATIF